MIRQLARPAIHVPFRGVQRPMWPYTINRDSPQNQNLVFWVPFGCGNVSSALSQSVTLEMARGRRGTSSGSGETVIGQLNQGYKTTIGVSDHISFGAYDGPTNEVTVLMWYQKLDTTARGATVTIQSGSTGIGVLLPWSDSTIYWDFGGFGSGQRLSVGGSLATNTDINCWAFTAGASGMQIFKNGVRVANTTTAATGCGTVGNWRIGAGYAGNAADLAISYDVRLYNRVLTAAEIWQMYDPRTRWDLYYPLRQRVYFDLGEVTPPAADPRKGDFFSPMTGF